MFSYLKYYLVNIPQITNFKIRINLVVYQEHLSILLIILDV